MLLLCSPNGSTFSTIRIGTLYPKVVKLYYVLDVSKFFLVLLCAILQLSLFCQFRKYVFSLATILHMNDFEEIVKETGSKKKSIYQQHIT